MPSNLVHPNNSSQNADPSAEVAAPRFSAEQEARRARALYEALLAEAALPQALAAPIPDEELG